MTVTAPPNGVERGDPEALIGEAWYRARRRRQRTAALIGVVLVSVVALSWAALSDDGTRGPIPGAQSGELPVRRGTVRYLYTRAIVATAERPVSGLSAGGTTIENWVGSDGSWRLRETVAGGAPGSLDVIVSGDGLLPPQANATAAFNGVPTNLRDPGDGLFTARELNSLPLTIPALKRRLERAVTALELRNLDAYVSPGPRRAARLARLRAVFLAQRTTRMLFAISALDVAPLPDSLPRALYRVARALPGVRVTADRDAQGRRGVEISGGGLALVFDPSTGALRSGTTGTFFDQGTAGTILAQGPVPNLEAVPHGVIPIRSAVLRPPTIKVAPAAGTKATTFTLRLAVAHTATATARAPALSAEMFGPTGPNCIYWLSRPPVARIATGTVTHDERHAFATYHITPATIGRSSLCPGRYELMLTPQRPRPARVTIPRSFAATYFTVH